MKSAVLRTVCGMAIVLLQAAAASALPTMVRIGYTNCAACHVSPQGAGPLTDYGRGIDRAQSLQGGEYRASEAHRKMLQDLRGVVQGTWVASHAPAVYRPRLMYRNVTELSKTVRLSGVATIEGATALRPSRAYDPATPASTFFVNTALAHYRPRPTLELAAGRDQLPSGVNISDLGTYIKSRNRLGYYDSPTQVKMYWWGKRHQVTPFLYAPGGNEPSGEHESGGGALAEFDVLGNQHTVVGTTVLKGTARNGDRQMIGGYARLGFGPWGVLAEHDVTDRTRTTLTRSFRQNATFTQVFWATREWLVLSLVGERLRVEAPFAQRLNAAKVEVAARLAPQATVIVGTRAEKNLATGILTKSLLLQIAFKTVN